MAELEFDLAPKRVGLSISLGGIAEKSAKKIRTATRVCVPEFGCWPQCHCARMWGSGRCLSQGDSALVDALPPSPRSEQLLALAGLNQLSQKQSPCLSFCLPPFCFPPRVETTRVPHQKWSRHQHPVLDAPASRTKAKYASLLGK